MSDWISVKDRLPEDFERALVCNINSDVFIAYYCLDKNSWLTLEREISSRAPIKYWMPLPEAPKGEE